MKCPKCGYHSFDHLDNCRKCHQALAEHKARFNLRGFFSPERPVVAESAFAVMDSHDADEPACDRTVDFGFDFLDEEPEQLSSPAGSSFDGKTRSVAINQPFAADSETIPAGERAVNPDSKPGKGPQFAF